MAAACCSIPDAARRLDISPLHCLKDACLSSDIAERAGRRAAPVRITYRVLKNTDKDSSIPKIESRGVQLIGDDQDITAMYSWSLIGRVAAAAASVDQLLDDTIWTIAGIDHEYGACITSQLGSNFNRFVVIESILKLRDAPDDVIRKLNKLSQRWKGLGEKRNRAVHDSVAYDTENKKIFVRTIASRPGEGLKYLNEPFDYEKYRKTGDDIVNFVREFLIFRDEFLSFLQTS